MAESTPTPDEMSFGDALQELEDIVSALEGGQLELEESLSRYERGVALLKTLQGKLGEAQQKVTMLIGELEAEAVAADTLAAAADAQDADDSPGSTEG